MLTIDVNECLQEIPEINVAEHLYRRVHHRISLTLHAANEDEIEASLIDSFG